MNFPSAISFTVTNTCNLRCRMCGQWSEEGYIHNEPERLKGQMPLDCWLRLVDECADNGVKSILLRGGEPFLLPGIMDLIAHINSRGIFTSIDTNATRLKDHAPRLVELGNIHLTISMDGPEPVHDSVRGVPGTYARVRESVAAIHQAECEMGKQISMSLNFTISRYSLPGMAQLPDVARSLGIGVVCIVPYYYFPTAVGEAYAAELEREFGCPAYSWRGFHHEDSGVDLQLFSAELRTYLQNLSEGPDEGLGKVYSFPYMPLTEAEYHAWFSDAVTPVGPQHCNNVEHLIDIQPDGSANFCVDFPDYSIGSVRENTIAGVWNSERAERFREYRRNQPLPVCLRCGGKYMSEMG